MRRLLSIVVGWSVLVAAGAGAQEPDWEAFRDSLAVLTDVPALHRLQGRLPMPGMAATPEPLIERGLIRLRIWELTGDLVDAELAEDVFERGVERFPQVAWLHYGLALAHAGAHESQQATPGGITLGASISEILRRDPRSRARRAALAALELDPSLAGAAVLLGELAVWDSRDRAALEEAKAALEALRDDGYMTADGQRALADVETALGNYADAERALEAVAVEDASGSHARAVALLLQPGREVAGAGAYWAAVDSLDEAAADRLFEDVQAIVNENETADWRAADVLDAKRMWLRRFWSRRAAESGVPESERMAEHYRRLALAKRDYLRNSRRGIAGSGVLLSDAWIEDSPFDDRGIVLLKRGLPVRVVTTRVRGVVPNETWVYHDPDIGGNLLFHFAALRGSRDYSLVSDLLQAVDPVLDPIGNYDTYRDAILGLIGDRAAFEPRYQVAAGRLRSELQAAAQLGRPLDATGLRSIFRNVVEVADAEYRQDARRALASDVYVARFDRALPFHYDLFTFRAPFGRTDLTAAFAAPAEATAAVERQGRLVYPVNVSVILMDTLTDEVLRRDTTLRIVPEAPLTAGEFVRGFVTMPVVPSEHIVYRIVLRSMPISAGAVYSGGTRLKDYTGLELQLSDLVLAAPDSGGAWVRGDLRLDVTLPRRFEPDHPFTLFYEVYNLEADDPYRTHLTVDPVGRGGPFNAIKRLLGFGGPRVDLRFDERAELAADGSVREIRTLGTDLPPGRYRMRVTVDNVRTGERASSETIFEVIG